MGRDRQRASWSTSQCADDRGLRHAVHLPLTVGHPLWVKMRNTRPQQISSGLSLITDLDEALVGVPGSDGSSDGHNARGRSRMLRRYSARLTGTL
jgi:hypothetical protein